MDSNSYLPSASRCATEYAIFHTLALLPKRIWGPLALVLLSVAHSGTAQTATENYVKTTTYKVPTTVGITNPSASAATVEITYMDGLGRPKQRIAHKQAGDGDDLVTHIEYDGFGRQPREYLPYARSASLNFDGGALSGTTSFYLSPSNGPTTSNPWSEKLLEVSPLGRVLEQASPGDDWAMDNGHTVKLSYETNTASEVHKFSVSDPTGTPALVHEGHYAGQQLYKTVTKNENWSPGDGQRNTVTQFKDKMGRVVLKRTYEPYSGSGRGLVPGADIALDTYYVYDVLGKPTFVLPPKLSKQIPDSGGIPQHLLDALAYQYRYDHRNRMIEKRIPGKDHWDYMVYDALDRLIATGPALSPFGDGAQGWLHTKYDIHGRVAYTLWKQAPVGKAERQEMAMDLSTYTSEVRISGTNTVNGVTFNYSNQVAPTSGYHILTINYYDDYTYTGAPGVISSTVGNGDISVHYNNANKKPKGLPTGGWTRQLETAAQANGIKSYTLYDDKARPVRATNFNAANGYTYVDTKYDFIGNPLYTKTWHKKDASGPMVIAQDVFTYTPQSRPLGHTHKIGNGAVQLLSLNSYDALGRLKGKKVGGTDVSGAAALQRVDYSYNVRGWLTGINNIGDLAHGPGSQDLFAFKINYATVDNDINGSVKPLYNGNIAETYWRTASDNIMRKYGYAYDHQDRLLAAHYQLPGTAVPVAESYSTRYGYDRNGNLMWLQRNGERDMANSVVAIDDLEYTYDAGNRLTGVKDKELHPAGFDDGYTSLTTDDFEYDAYGNLTVDRNKDIIAVIYNHLNLPTRIIFDTDDEIEYLYDATGTKLKKIVTDGSTATTTEYLDGFQYTNGALDFFPHAEGYVQALGYAAKKGTGPPPSYIFRYIFTYTDHLGNVRLKYAQDPGNGNALAILEENHYYPFGLQHKGYNGDHRVLFADLLGGNVSLVPVTPYYGDRYKYKFGGKEYQDEFDINTYDFGARNYDPALGRWMKVDPLAEQRSWLSPYNFVQNNPINRIDPDGALDASVQGPDDWVEKADGTIYWDDNATSQETTKSGETYLGKNVLVGTHNRDATGNEAINTAQFDLYLESDKTGPTATIKGNTVPSDITKSGTLAEGLYSAKFGHRNRKKYHNELAIRIYNLDGSDGLPTVNGNPSKANSDLLTGVLFHMGNNYQTSLFDSRGNAYSSGCQTSGCYPNSRSAHNAFMNKVGRDFKGTYYLRSKPTLTVPAIVPFSSDIPGRQ